MSVARQLRNAVLVLLAVTCSVALLGCSPQNPTFVDKGASYDQASVMTLTRTTDMSRLLDLDADKAPGLRHKALTGLRSRGGTAVTVADMVTKTFSAETRAVPVYFERAAYDGTPAVIVIEAAGPAGGKLSAKRVWVLDEKGGVRFVGSQ